MHKHNEIKKLFFRENRFKSSIILNGFFIIVTLFCLLPMLYIISISFTPESLIYSDGFRLIPRGFTTMAYRMVFKSKEYILNAYKISAIVTVFGTILGMLVSTMLAYPISRIDFRYRNKISFIVFFTMLFNGGLVPWYMVVTKVLRIQNTLLALILPYTVIPMFILFLKGFLSSLPLDMFEAAKIDGARELRIFFTIVIPLSKPGLATVSFFYALMYWNDWWLSLMFIEKNDLIPLQFLIYRLMNNIEFMINNAKKMVGLQIDLKNLPSESLKMATMIVTAGPMLFVFPFFQKYFIKGLTVGSVKS